MNEIFIAIPVYNRKKLTNRCLTSLLTQTYRDFKIVVCDDGSTDGTADMIKKDFPEIVLLKGKGTLYWSGGYNLCLKYIFKNATNQDYLLSLNNDIGFDDDYLSELKIAAEDNPDKMIISAAYDSENKAKVVMQGCNADSITLRQVSVKNPSVNYDAVNNVCGRGLLIPIIIAKKIGYADQRRFPMVGDHDLSFRYRKNDIKAVVAYKAKIYTGPSYTQEEYFNKYSFKNFISYITDIKSTGNLKYRFWAIVKNRPFYLILVNLFFDINCIVFGYFKRWFLQRIKLKK